MKTNSIFSKMVSSAIIIAFLSLETTGAYSYFPNDPVHQETDTLSTWSVFQQESLRGGIDKMGVTLAIADWYFSPGVSDSERLLNYLEKVLDIEYTSSAEGFNLEEVRPDPERPDTLLIPYVNDKGDAGKQAAIIRVTPIDRVSGGDMDRYDSFIGGYAVQETVIASGSSEKLITKRPVSEEEQVDEYKYADLVSFVNIDLTLLDDFQIAEVGEDIEAAYEEYKGSVQRYDPSEIDTSQHVKLSTGQLAVIASKKNIKKDSTKKMEKRSSGVTHVFHISGEPYLFGHRGRNYGEGHMVMGRPNLAQGPLTPELVEAMILLTKVRGEKYESFFNGVGPSGNNFHTQSLKKVTLISEMSDEALERWPAYNERINSSAYGNDTAEMAKAVHERYTHFLEKGVKSDIFLHLYGDGGNIRVILIPRVETRPAEFLKENPAAYGDFGGLEMGGYILTLKTPEAEKELARNPGLYEKALRELSYVPDTDDANKSALHKEKQGEESAVDPEISDMIRSLNHGFLIPHVERATAINLLVGRELGLNENEMELLKYASMYHDVGAGIRGQREEDFADLTNVLKNAEPGKSIKKAVEAIIERKTPQGRTVSDLTLEEKYEIFRNGMIELLSRDPDNATEEMIFSLFDVAENSVKILKEKGIEMSPDLEMIIRYHNDYPGLIRNYDKIQGLTLSKNRAALIVSILFMTDAFEHGNNYNTQVMQRKKERVENLFETFNWIEKQFSDNNISDRSPCLVLKDLLIKRDFRLMRVILSSRESDELMPEDEQFLKLFAFGQLDRHSLVKDILSKEGPKWVTPDTVKFDLSINGGHERHVLSAFEDLLSGDKRSFRDIKLEDEEPVSESQAMEAMEVVKNFEEKDILVMRWALLLHDIGKTRGLGEQVPHPEISWEIAKEILSSQYFEQRETELGLGQAEKELVLWLIRSHDAMGNVRTRERSPRGLLRLVEEATNELKTLGKEISYEKIMDMLFIVTLCDARGYTRSGKLFPILSDEYYRELTGLRSEINLNKIQKNLFEERILKWQEDDDNTEEPMDETAFREKLDNEELFDKIKIFFGERITLFTNALYILGELSPDEIVEFCGRASQKIDNGAVDVRVDFERALPVEAIKVWLNSPDKSRIVMEFEWTDKEKNSGRVFIKRTNILDISGDDILGLVRPGNEELKRHMTADLKYAEAVASSAGYGDNKDFMNKLRVISMSHDVGGVLGNPDDEVLEGRLLRLAKENGIAYSHRDPADVLNDFAKAGVDLTAEEKNFVNAMDHAENSVRILKANGVDIPEDVEFVIKNHMDALSEDELNALPQATRDLYLCLVVADVFEFGNNYYKHFDPVSGEVRAFEDPERTLNFLKNIKFKDNSVAQGFFEKLDMDALGDAIVFSRESRETARADVEVEIRSFKSERGPETKMAVALFSEEVEAIPVFQPDIEKSWGMLRDKAPMHFRYKLAGRDVSDVDDLAPDYENARKDVWTIERYLSKFQEDHPDMEIVGFVGNGNILANAHLVSYVNGRKYGTESELERIYQGDSRVYPSLVMWNDGHFSVEDIEYLQDGKIIMVGTGRNIRDEVRFINSGIGILKDGEPYDLAQNYEHDYDVRHYLDFPFIPGANVHFGVNLFYDVKGSPIRHLMQDAINEIPVTLPLEDKENKIIGGTAQEVRTKLTPEQVNMLEENLLKEKGYERVSSSEEVAYGKFFIDRAGGTITIGLMRGINPHNISCIDNNGKLVSVVVSGKSNRIGITFKEAQEVLKGMGMKSAVIFDNGADVMMNIKGETMIESFQKRDRITSLMIFAKQKKRDEANDISGNGADGTVLVGDEGRMDNLPEEAKIQTEETVTQPAGKAETEPNSRRARTEKAANGLASRLGVNTQVDRKGLTAEMVRDVEDILQAGSDLSEPEAEEISDIFQNAGKNLDQITADGLVAGLIVLARKAAREGQQLIVGLETEWIPGIGKAGHLQNDGMNPVLREIRGIGDKLKELGIDNVVIIHSGSSDLGESIKTKADETGTKLSNVVVLASEDTVRNKLEQLKGDPKEAPFMAGVDGGGFKDFYADNPGKEPVVDIVSMLTLAVELASGVVIRDPGKIKMIKGGIYDPSARMVFFSLPDMKPVNPEDLKSEYLFKLEALIRA